MIEFKPPGSLSRIASAALAALALGILVLKSGTGAEAVNRPDLTGVILGSDSSPVAEATVFIHTAAPRTGTSTICPSCYLDCRKRARTDAQGHFKIKSLSTDLLFRILVVVENYKPRFEGKVDPATGPVTVRLEKFNLASLGPKQSLRGRVTDLCGNPVPGATVNFEGFYGEGVDCGGACEGVDPVAVTDRKGEFLLGSDKKFGWMDVCVEASGFARRKFFYLASTNSHELKLAQGAAISGRITKNGKPLQGINAGLVSVDRSDNFTGDFEAATDAEGRFLFANIPPYHQYSVYAKMGSAKELGCVPVKRIRVGADGTTKDAGELALVPGFRLAGRVVLSDGKRLPGHTRVQISRQDAWDFQTVEADAEGKFVAVGLPPEPCTIDLSVPGYRLSAKQEGLDPLSGPGFSQDIEQDTSIVVLLDPQQPGQH